LDHYIEVTLWAIGALVGAVCVASLAAVPPRWVIRLVSWLKVWPGPAMQSYIENRRRRDPITPESGWGAAFHQYPDQLVYVGLRLKDGSYLDGPLGMFSSQIEENDNRSIQIVRPVRIRVHGRRGEGLGCGRSDRVREPDQDSIGQLHPKDPKDWSVTSNAPDHSEGAG